MWVRSPGREDPLEEGMATPVFLPGDSHGQRNLACYSPQGLKESDMTKAPQHIHTPQYIKNQAHNIKYIRTQL